MPSPANRQRATLALAACVISLFLLSHTARADGQVVNSLLDDGPGDCSSQCTLRDALATSPDGTTITFSVSGTIVLKEQLKVSRSLVIQGPYDRGVALDGRRSVRLFEFPSKEAHVRLSGLTLQNGDAVYGGAIANVGVLELSNVRLVQNNASLGGAIETSGSVVIFDSIVERNTGLEGGAIRNRGSLTIKSTDLSRNVSRGFGGAILNLSGRMNIESSTLSGNIASGYGGAIQTYTASNITNSTLSDNYASMSGGAIRAASDTLTISHSTITLNTSPSGGGLSTGRGTILLRNSIVARNLQDANCVGNIVSTGNNLSDTSNCFTGDGLGDMISSDVRLGALTVNAPGRTPTHALLPGSPAIDAVTHEPDDCPTSVARDQRGVVRPQLATAHRCDIGAYEFQTGLEATD